jgi:class 3 adenylate cyclase
VDRRSHGSADGEAPLKREVLAVGFAGLTNFARWAEDAGPERVAQLLHDAYSAGGDVIVRHGGRIRKYVGDAILFTFPDVERAAAAASEIASSFHVEERGLVLRFSVAIASGEVAVARVGHPTCVVEDLFGRTVNRAAVALRGAGRSDSRIVVLRESA